jgi:hypothetical protein
MRPFASPEPGSYQYADQLSATSSENAISFGFFGFVKSMTSTPPVYQAFTSK